MRGDGDLSTEPCVARTHEARRRRDARDDGRRRKLHEQVAQVAQHNGLREPQAMLLSHRDGSSHCAIAQGV
jgi:hypothetical protein